MLVSVIARNKKNQESCSIFALAYVTPRNEDEEEDKKKSSETCSFLKKTTCKNKMKKNRARFLHIACFTLELKVKKNREKITRKKHAKINEKQS